MKRTYINDLKNHGNEEVVVKGFIDKIRDLQYVQFIILRDITGKVQITVEKNEENKELTEIFSNLPLESTISATCKVLINEKVKMGGLELIPSKIEVTSRSLPELPFDIKSKDNALRETRLDYRFLDLRREENQLLFKCETYLEHSMRQFCLDNNFIEIHSPKIAEGTAEGGAEVFKLDYFGKQASLSQSPQFYKQMAIASGFDKVFEIGTVFRAENSHTSYHATEINMVDIEIGDIDSVSDVMDFQEAWLKYSFTKLKEKYGEEIKKHFNIEISDVNFTFPRITFKEAKEILKEKYHYTGSAPEDFERKEEELLGKYAKEKYKSDFIFITNYPYSARPFYSMKNEEGTTETYDLLYKGIEITSGAQREHRYDILTKQIEEKEIDPKTLDFYIEFFKYGCPPHGGFGFGMARLLMRIFEIDNIREATFIYRGPTRLKP